MVTNLAKKDAPPSPSPKPRVGLKLHVDIWMAFFRSGMLGFGGGPSAIPLVHAEVVKRYKWMNDDEFSDTLALGNTMPGPIATKMAGYIGYRLAGVLGCLNALIATVAPTGILMVVLLQILQAYKDIPWVQHMSTSVIPVVAVMIAVMTWDFVKKSGESFGWLKATLLLAGSLFLIEMLGIHPAFLIVIMIALAFVPAKQREVSR